MYLFQSHMDEEIESHDKLHHIVHELMVTERVYVEKLSILSTVSKNSLLEFHSFYCEIINLISLLIV